jgi:hypothetical protein
MSNVVSIDLESSHHRIMANVFDHVKKKMPPDLLLLTIDGTAVCHRTILEAASSMLQVNNMKLSRKSEIFNRKSL